MKSTPVPSQKMREEVVLRPHASFEIPPKFLVGCNATDRSSRLAAASKVATRLAADLAEKGYSVSKVGPGSGGGAGFSCRLNRDCEVTVHLGLEQQEGDAVRFYLLSWQTSSFLRRVFRGGVKSLPDCDQRWNDLCCTMNEIFVKSFESTSVVWRTEGEERKAARLS